MKPRLRKKIGELSLAKFMLMRARLHLISRNSEDLTAEMLLDSLASSLDIQITQLILKGRA